MNLLGLLGLLTLPMIIILHLLRERQTRRTVSSLDLWAWLKPEVRGALPRRVPWNRVLALQLLAALFLTAALVNPQLPLPLPFLQAQRLILVVDNSSSMSAADAFSGPARLALAQTRAAARLAALGADDSAVLITISPVARKVSDSAQTGLTALGAEVASLQAAGMGHDWAAALALASASIAPGPGTRNRIVIYTDGAFEFPESINMALPASVEWNLIGEAQPNQAIVTLAARPTASGAQQVFARVANFSLTPVERLLTLLADGEPVDSSQLSLPASSSTALAWTLPPGARTVEARLADIDVFPADDRAALGLSNPPVNALLVSRASVESADRCAETLRRTPIERALCAFPNLQLKTLHPETYVGYEPHDLYIFQGWLPDAWPQGGVLVIDPPPDSALLPIGESFPITTTLITNSLLADVSFEGVTLGRAIGLQAPDWLLPVYADQNGAALIWRGATGSIRVVVLALNLSEGNLTKRSAFPILIANAARELLPPPFPESVSPGESVSLPSAQVFPALTLTDPQGRTQTFGANRPVSFGNTARAGLYRLEGLTPDGQSKIFGFGVNAGSPAESDLSLRASPKFSSAPEQAPRSFASRLPLADLWPLFVIGVLALMIMEARFAWR